MKLAPAVQKSTAATGAGAAQGAAQVGTTTSTGRPKSPSSTNSNNTTFIQGGAASAAKMIRGGAGGGHGGPLGPSRGSHLFLGEQSGSSSKGLSGGGTRPKTRPNSARIGTHNTKRGVPDNVVSRPRSGAGSTTGAGSSSGGPLRTPPGHAESQSAGPPRGLHGGSGIGGVRSGGPAGPHSSNPATGARNSFQEFLLGQNTNVMSEPHQVNMNSSEGGSLLPRNLNLSGRNYCGPVRATRPSTAPINGRGSSNSSDKSFSHDTGPGRGPNGNRGPTATAAVATATGQNDGWQQGGSVAHHRVAGPRTMAQGRDHSALAPSRDRPLSSSYKSRPLSPLLIRGGPSSCNSNSGSTPRGVGSSKNSNSRSLYRAPEIYGPHQGLSKKDTRGPRENTEKVAENPPSKTAARNTQFLSENLMVEKSAAAHGTRAATAAGPLDSSSPLRGPPPSSHKKSHHQHFKNNNNMQGPGGPNHNLGRSNSTTSLSRAFSAYGGRRDGKNDGWANAWGHFV